jgi:hypothetical protein
MHRQEENDSNSLSDMSNHIEKILIFKNRTLVSFDLSLSHIVITIEWFGHWAIPFYSIGNN